LGSDHMLPVALGFRTIRFFLAEFSIFEVHLMPASAGGYQTGCFMVSVQSSSTRKPNQNS
jgi:hypothetical protein